MRFILIAYVLFKVLTLPLASSASESATAMNCLKASNQGQEGYVFKGAIEIDDDKIARHNLHIADGKILQLDDEKFDKTNHGYVDDYCYQIPHEGGKKTVWITCPYPRSRPEADCFEAPKIKAACDRRAKVTYSVVQAKDAKVQEAILMGVTQKIRILKESLSFAPESQVQEVAKKLELIERSCDGLHGQVETIARKNEMLSLAKQELVRKLSNIATAPKNSKEPRLPAQSAPNR